MEIFDSLQLAQSYLSVDPEKSKQIYLSLLVRSFSTGYTRGIIRAATGIANTHISLEEYEPAILQYKNTIEELYTNGHPDYIIGKLYNNLGNVYSKIADYENAIKSYQQSLDYDPPESKTFKGEVYVNLGNLFIQMKQYEKAITYLDLGIVTGQAIKDSLYLLNIYANKGSCLSELGKWEESFQATDTALSIARAIHDMHAVFLILTNNAEQYRKYGDYPRSLSILSEAEQWIHQAAPYSQLQYLTVLGNTYLDQNNTKQAKEIYEEIIVKAAPKGLNKQLLQAHQSLAYLYEQEGNHNKALSHFKAYSDLKDSVFKEELQKNAIQWDIRYKSTLTEKELAESQLRLQQKEAQIRKKNLTLTIVLSSVIILAAGVIILINYLRISRTKSRLQEEELRSMDSHKEIIQLKAMITGEENERQRIARELHDGVGGMLAVINMHLSDSLDKEPDHITKHKLNRISAMLRDTSDEVRKTAHNLLPDILTYHNLEEALLYYCEQVNINEAFQIAFQYHADTSLLTKSTQLIIYRISQELIQNIQKHAKAQNAWLMIKQLKDKLSIIIEDDGIGFDTNTGNSGFGLLNLKHRVEALRGTINIHSIPRRGTTVHIEFDINLINQH
ncbi:MAG: tetratricopeptide repeat protein [Taibaiella sp.]|nr:tetratricopeptide repeat protein [Taibaiella sp.]MBX9449685.1 tetratricopeptide repeat protein [Taibaiella sp.]